MSHDTPPPAGDELQFDRVVPAGPAPAAPAVACALCRTPLAAEYHHLGSHVVCGSCRKIAEQQAVMPTGPGPLARAALLGVGAAIAGAAVYYGVLVIAHLEIGLVAILIGYMVGWAVRRGAGGRGGRRFQVLAAALTYWSVGLAYVPLAFGRLPEATAHAIGPALLLAFVLPVESVVRTLPGGLLSGAIIVFGILQAWRMTAALHVATSGPYRIGPGGAPAPR